MNNPPDILVGLDVGTTKVLCVVARPAEEVGFYRIEGYGLVQSEGISHGVVTDIEGAVKSIRSAIKEAQYTAQVPFTEAVVAIGGSTLTSEDCVGTAVVRGREVTPHDVTIAEANARENVNRKDRQLMKMIAQGYRAGDVVTPTPPIGFSADRIEALYHSVFGSISNAENMRRCLQRSSLELLNYEPHPWAAARAVLSETEKYCGTVVFDLGAQTTSISLFHENVITFTDVRPYGSEFFTRDIAIIFGLTLEQAEEMKLTSGHCDLSRVRRSETVQPRDQKGVLPRLYSKELLVKTLRGRALEIFRLYKKDLEEAGMLPFIHSVVLTGGGANLSGIELVAEEVFGVPVRIGTPRYVRGQPGLIMKPEASVAMGLISSAGEALAQGEEHGHRPKGFSTRFGWLKTLFTGNY